MLDVDPITSAIGAEIRNFDASVVPDDATAAELRALWVQHKLLVLRDQQLTPDQQLAFTGVFGDIEQYPFLSGIEGYPLIAPVLKLPDEKVNFGGVWHSDTAYLERPAAGATLYARELPPLGGDTIFCNMALAYRSLPAGVRQRIDSLTAVNCSAKAAVSRTRVDRDNSPTRQTFEETHPVVRTHPETGERCLYVNEAHTTRINDLSEEQSDTLLAELTTHARQPGFQCRLRWRPNTLILWDNRSTHHYPVNDYHGHRRLLHRVSIAGDRPV